MSGRAERRARAKVSAVKDSRTVSSNGLSVADMKTEANTNSPLGTTCCVGYSQGKIHAIIDEVEF